MILPILAYGNPILKRKSADIERDYPELKKLISNMFDTMNNAYGVGLAAPQIGKNINLFVVDTTAFADKKNDKEKLKGFKKVFINPVILDQWGEEWVFNEGCLSIPDVREDIWRYSDIEIQYLDENFELQTEDYNGLKARVIQHEYDHLKGVLFTEKVSSLKKKLIKGKLNKISKGKVNADYKMSFYEKK